MVQSFCLCCTWRPFVLNPLIEVLHSNDEHGNHQMRTMENEIELNWKRTLSHLLHSYKSSIKCHSQKFNHIIFIACRSTSAMVRCSENHFTNTFIQPSIAIRIANVDTKHPSENISKTPSMRWEWKSARKPAS